jgi:hypothetical protein
LKRDVWTALKEYKKTKGRVGSDFVAEEGIWKPIRRMEKGYKFHTHTKKQTKLILCEF